MFNYLEFDGETSTPPVSQFKLRFSNRHVVFRKIKKGFILAGCSIPKKSDLSESLKYPFYINLFYF
jgi:hypothetical protein